MQKKSEIFHVQTKRLWGFSRYFYSVCKLPNKEDSRGCHTWEKFLIALSYFYGLNYTEEISHGGESTPSVYPFAMDTSGAFCDTAILFLKKIALVKFSNEPGSDPLLAWKRASWVQETCSLIQAAVLRTASRLFHRGLRECFEKDYEHLFDVPQQLRTDNDVSGLSPIYIPAAG